VEPTTRRQCGADGPPAMWSRRPVGNVEPTARRQGGADDPSAMWSRRPAGNVEPTTRRQCGADDPSAMWSRRPVGVAGWAEAAGWPGAAPALPCRCNFCSQTARRRAALAELTRNSHRLPREARRRRKVVRGFSPHGGLYGLKPRTTLRSRRATALCRAARRECEKCGQGAEGSRPSICAGPSCRLRPSHHTDESSAPHCTRLTSATPRSSSRARRASPGQ